MGVAEKKAMRQATDAITEATNKLRETTGVNVESEIDFSPIETEEATLLKASNVPTRIIEFVSTLLEDEDYKEAFNDEKVTALKFVPVEENGFDYETAASLENGTLKVTYLPMSTMHGGYERSIKGLF